jgi:hypothetical protein
MWRLLAVVLFLCAVPFGLLFVDTFVTHVATGPAIAYCAMVLYGGCTAALVFAGRASLQHARLRRS